MDGNGIQLSTVGDAILARLNADWRMACDSWLRLASARAISVKPPPLFENSQMWLADAAACLCSKACTPQERLWLAASRLASFLLLLMVMSFKQRTVHTVHMPTCKLRNWKSVLTWVWDAVWKSSVSFMLTRTVRADCKHWCKQKQNIYI